MPTVTQWMRSRLLSRVQDNLPSLEELRVSERSPEFERLRANRKVIGAMRYGLLGASDKAKYNRARDMIRRLEEYIADRNAEHLIDVANLAECEFVEGDHRGVIPSDDGQHTPLA